MSKVDGWVVRAGGGEEAGTGGGTSLGASKRDGGGGKGERGRAAIFHGVCCAVRLLITRESTDPDRLDSGLTAGRKQG